MQTYLALEYAHETPLPDGVDEVRTPDALVEQFLEAYSTPGDCVIDPFAGFGTTLRVAAQLDRIPYGVEYEPERVAHAREHVEHGDHVRQGSVLDLEPGWFPECELAFTSPPFMEQTDGRNPFENYTGESSYGQYLEDVETAFRRLDGVLAEGAHVVVDVANMKYRDRVTTLAWDVAEQISDVFHFEGEVVVTWEGESPPEREGTFGYGYDHSYCLVFRNDGEQNEQ